MSDAQFAMVSDWMGNGNISDFVKAHPDTNRLELVGFSSLLSCPRFKFTDNRATFQLGGVARGLIYIHNEGMIHGDLKGVRSRQRVTFLSYRVYQGKHPDRPIWSCPPRGFWSAYHYLGSSESFVLHLVHTGWHGQMDGSRAHRSAAIRVQQEPSNESFGLLCPRNGCI